RLRTGAIPVCFFRALPGHRGPVVLVLGLEAVEGQGDPDAHEGQGAHQGVQQGLSVHAWPGGREGDGGGTSDGPPGQARGGGGGGSWSAPITKQVPQPGHWTVFPAGRGRSAFRVTWHRGQATLPGSMAITFLMGEATKVEGRNLL